MTDRLNASQKAEARETYLSNPDLSVAALAASYGVGMTVMLRVLTGITRPRGQRPKSRLTSEQMVKLWSKGTGLTLFEIGRMAGISESAVHHRIRKHNEKVQDA